MSKRLSSNPSAAYQMDHFSHLFVVKIACVDGHIENKLKRGREWPI